MKIKAVAAVARKDLTQMVRYPTWIIQLIIWPLIFPLAYILSANGLAGPSGEGFQSFAVKAGTDQIAGYLVIGSMIWMMVNLTMWNYGSYLREEQLRGTLESNWLCPINKFDILIGGSAISFVTVVISIIVSILEYRFVYRIHFTGNVFSWILVFAALLPGIYGIGTMLASLVLKLKEVNAAVNVARGLMMILCGITFPISVMPHFMQVMAKFIPYTFGIEAGRQVMLMDSGIKGASRNILICLIEGIVYMIIGRLVFISVENGVKEAGSLDRF